MSPLAEALVGVAVLAGVVGVVVPVLPGSLLVWAAVLVWAVATGSLAGWLVLAAATAFIGTAQVVKYVVPDRRLQAAGVPRRSVVVGGLAGLVGFFVVPVVGLVLGFLGGVYAAERRRLRDHAAAWRATTQAVRAVGVSVLVELTGAIAAGLVWLAGAALTGG